MSDREKARDLGNQSAALARSIADLLTDTLDALEAAEAEIARLREALVFYRDSPAVDIACDQGHVASAALAPKEKP